MQIGQNLGSRLVNFRINRGRGPWALGTQKHDQSLSTFFTSSVIKRHHVLKNFYRKKPHGHGTTKQAKSGVTNQDDINDFFVNPRDVRCFAITIISRKR